MDQARIEGWTGCSYESCRRKLDEKIPPQIQAQFREPKRYRWDFAPYLEQNPEAWDAGCLWIGDHCQLDLLCRFGGRIIRPWLTAWMDWRTRRIAGFTLSDKPNSSTILAALRHGLIHDRDANMGGPDAVWIDNGKDFDSYTLQGQTKKERQAVRRIVEGFRLDHEQTYGVFGLLDIQVHFARPYNPNGKGREERWFGTLHDQFDRTFKTYCSSSPDRKPENLKDILKQSHLIREFEHVRDRLGNYIKGYNANADHSRQDMAGWSPDAMLLAKCPRKRVMAEPEALDRCLQHWHKPVRVGRNGVSITPCGKAITYGAYADALARFKGTKRTVNVSYDPADMTTIHIFDEKWQFVCTAPMNQRGGGVAISQDALKEQIRKQNRYKKSKRDVARNSHYEYLSTAEQIALDAPPDPPQQPAQPAALQFVQMPLDEASKAIQREQLRKAAGAEHDESPRGLPSPSELLRDAGLGLSMPFAFDRAIQEVEDTAYSRLSDILGDDANEPIPVIDILGRREGVSP